MYEEFGDLRTVTRTQTNVLLLLQEPRSRSRAFTNVVNVLLDGTMEVYTQAPVETREGRSLLPWWVGEMPSSGESKLGEIRMAGSPDLQTTGVISQDYRDREFPGTLEAAVYQVFEIPEYGRLHNRYPVVISGDVQEIPPYFTVARCAQALLLDDDGVPKGLVGGRSLTLLGPA